MDMKNQTQETEFIFLGFAALQGSQSYLFFLLFLAVYLATIMGNLTILILVITDPSLHSPMYFFLGHLSCMDICLSSVAVPKILVNLLRQKHTISYNGCLTQLFFQLGFAGCETNLLAIMAYDRYAAICQPLRYSVLMSKRICLQLAVATWLWGFLHSALHAALASTLYFCGVNRIPHIFCDVPVLVKIACSDTWMNELTDHITSVFVGMGPLLVIFFSYVYILVAILRIRSNTGRSKAFSTCASHLTVVIIYFGNGLIDYNQPSAGYSLQVDTFISTMYSIVTPMLNPLIYSLRNKEVKGAFQKALRSVQISPNRPMRESS